MLLFAYVFWDPKPEVFTVPFIHLPILWYGLFFAAGFMLGFPIFVGVLERFFMQDFSIQERSPKDISSLHRQAVHITDRLTIYMVIATIIGARVGHYLFYEKPSDYFHNLSELFGVWKMRGLSSHGAMMAIVLALGLFAYRNRSTLRGLSWLHLLDFVCVPAALAGAFIRLGNFFNQEILGTPSNVAWAVIFGHPADGSFPVPRHPVQLYEALVYGVVFVILWRLTFISKYLLGRGRLIGLFLVLVFGFRFIIEYWKEEQSLIMPNFFQLTMGQILSIPAVLVGIFLMARASRQV